MARSTKNLVKSASQDQREAIEGIRRGIKEMKDGKGRTVQEILGEGAYTPSPAGRRAKLAAKKHAGKASAKKTTSGPESGGDKKIELALAVQQPWANEIVAGTKEGNAEFRSRPTKLRERIYVYACIGMNQFAKRDCVEQRLDPDKLPRGVIIGTVEIAGCTWDEEQDCYAWKLRNPVQFQKPIRPMNLPCGPIFKPKLPSAPPR